MAPRKSGKTSTTSVSVKSPPLDINDPRYRNLRAVSIPTATGTTDHNSQLQLMRSLESVLPQLHRLSEQERTDFFAAALKLMEGLAPTDAAEGMLGLQMIAAHHAALECLRRAHIPDQPTASRDYNLKHAFRLFALYARQLEVLDRRRGKGPQKVTVETVKVEAGGQAVVGVVETKAASPPMLSAGQTGVPVPENLQRQTAMSSSKEPVGEIAPKMTREPRRRSS